MSDSYLASNTASAWTELCGELAAAAACMAVTDALVPLQGSQPPKRPLAFALAYFSRAGSLDVSTNQRWDAEHIHISLARSAVA